MKTQVRALCLVILVASGCARSIPHAAPAPGNAGAVESISGTWIAIISFGTDTITGLALLTQTGSSVNGSIGADEQNQHPLDGVVAGNRITLATHPRPGRTAAFDRSFLTLDGDKMRGTIDGSNGAGSISLVRARE